jgi:hypothetical protein
MGLCTLSVRLLVKLPFVLALGFNKFRVQSVRCHVNGLWGATEQ